MFSISPQDFNGLKFQSFSIAIHEVFVYGTIFIRVVALSGVYRVVTWEVQRVRERVM